MKQSTNKDKQSKNMNRRLLSMIFDRKVPAVVKVKHLSSTEV